MRKELLTVAALVAVAGVANAGTFIIAEETWGTVGNANGWQVTDDAGGASIGTPSVPAAGNPAASLQSDVDLAGNPIPQTDRLFADVGASGGAFVGDYTMAGGSPRSQFVSFDFYSYSNPGPAGLQLFFTSSTSPGATWYYNIGGSLGAGWNSYLVSMTAGGGWTDAGSGGTWATDIIDVDQIGVRITYLTNLDNQTYALDNFRRGYAVPEPGTFAALGFAFASMGITFRRRLNELMAKFRALIGK